MLCLVAYYGTDPHTCPRAVDFAPQVDLALVLLNTTAMPQKAKDELSKRAEEKYAVLFPENGGYLNACPLDSEGRASVVWSISDGKPYMRRKRAPYERQKETGDAHSKVQEPLQEVSWYHGQAGG